MSVRPHPKLLSSSGLRGGSAVRGKRFGPYIIDDEIGRGGMGAIFRVRHVETGGAYALKVLITRSGKANAKAVARFEREAQVLARIGGHPNVVRVHACGVEGGVPWCAMDLVDGVALADRVRAGAVPPRDAAALLASCARAVQHVHDHGIIHRDLKPENILIDGHGAPRVVDFGIAHDEHAERLTRSGEIVGTPAFMAPEQLSQSGGRAPVGPRTDVYGLGAVLYVTLTGKPLFHGQSGIALLGSIVKDEPAAPRSLDAEIPADLEAICLRAIEKDPGRRYGTAGSFADDLDRWLAGEPVRARRRGRLDRIARRFLPRSRGGQIAALLVVVSVASSSGALAVWSQLSRPPALRRVAELEERIDAEGRIDDVSRRRIAELDDLRPEDSHLARRVEVLDALVAIIDAPDGAGGSAAELASLVRDGPAVDETLIARARRVLIRADRPIALATVLFARQPEAPPPRDGVAAAAVAAAVARGEAPLPVAEPMLEALLAVPGLDAATRGELLCRRGERALGRGDAGVDEALDAFVAALRDHGVLGRVDAWPDALAARARARLPDLVDAGEVREAWAMGRLLARAEGAEGGLPVDLVVALQEHALAATFIAAGGLERDSREIRRGLLAGAFLERYGRCPLDRDGFRRLGAALGLDDIRVRGEAELARPTDELDAALLLLLADMLLGAAPDPCPAEVRTRARAWVDAALATSIEEAWLPFQASLVLRQLDELAPALELIERAWELDRGLPDDERWPTIACEYQRQRWDEAKRIGRGSYRPFARIHIEAARVQEAVVPIVDAVVSAGGYEPWNLDARGDVAEGLLWVAMHMLSDDDLPCCQDPDGELPSLDEIAAEALGYKIDGDQYRGRLHATLARHHHRHGRLEEALAEATEAIDAERIEKERGRVIEFLEGRVVLLRALGREDEARVDLDEIQTLRRRRGR